VRPGTPPALIGVVSGRDNLTAGAVVHGKLYLGTNIDAPKSRVVVADDPTQATDPTRWRTVIPEGAGNIENWTFVDRSTIAVQTIEDVQAKVRLYRASDGHPLGEVALPTRGELAGFAGDVGSPMLAFAFDSFFFPPTLFTITASAHTPVELDRVQSDVDTSAFELEQEHVASADGTSINVYLVHKRGLARDGNNPVLLTAYGGFNVSLYATFTRHVLYFLERGGVYAVANLRGGGENGETWHQAGNLLNKKHVFEDMEAVLRWLSTSGLSKPERIAITGGSNGGLLMGAMITRCPETFRAVASYVGLYDMVRYERFPPAEIWATEYGSAEDPAQLRYLLSYSPYHNVHDRTAYPAALIETADHDSRVYWGHSTKFAARLQQATSSDRPIYFYMVHDVGHGSGTRLTDLVSRYDRMYAFLEDQLAIR
jgi:prolyl oligopeptidase